VLFSGSAQAQTVNPCADGSCDFTEWATKVNGVAINPLLVGDKIFTFDSFTPVGTTTLPSGSVSSTIPVPGDYLFNFDFTPISNIAGFTLNYIAEVDLVKEPHNFFTGVDLDSDVDAFTPPDEQLDVTWCTGGFGCPGTPGTLVAATLNSSNGSSSVAGVAGGPTKLYVANVYDSNDGAIDSFVNSYRQGTTNKVPGPLPLLGAGMAFGFSRKLRSRIKARVQA
jgi:hypothetical protein